MKQRRHFTANFKAEIVSDILTGVRRPAEARRTRSLGPNLPALWKATFLEQAATVLQADRGATGRSPASPSWSGSWAG